MKRLLLLLGCLLPLTVLAAPRVLVESRIDPPGTALVGSTVRLQVDVLVDTWFTAAPQLPGLDLPGALVRPPGGEATHLTLQRDGGTLFGLRYDYLITPSQTGELQIPALSIRVSAGQGDGPVTVRTQPLSLLARLPEGVASGQHVLVAQDVTLDQQVRYSQEPLRVGDSVQRRLTIDASGAQAMLIPPPEFAEVDGLKRYLKTPQVLPLDDGRGSITGGRRVDEASYVIARAGHYRLPAIELHWWDASANRQRTATAPALEFEAAAAVYQAPFSIADDLRQLGHQAHLRIARHWLLLGALLVAGGLAWYWGRPWARRGLAAWRSWRAERRQAYLRSPACAWRQVAGQLGGRPPQLGALYLWTRRLLGANTLAGLTAKLPGPLGQRLLVFLKTRYGPAATDSALAELQRALPELRQATRQWRPARTRHALAPLNPRHSHNKEIP
ncbi:Oxygen tolerance [compost metagenome]